MGTSILFSSSRATNGLKGMKRQINLRKKQPKYALLDLIPSMVCQKATLNEQLTNGRTIETHPTGRICQDKSKAKALLSGFSNLASFSILAEFLTVYAAVNTIYLLSDEVDINTTRDHSKYTQQVPTQVLSYLMIVKQSRTV